MHLMLYYFLFLNLFSLYLKGTEPYEKGSIICQFTPRLLAPVGACPSGSQRLPYDPGLSCGKQGLKKNRDLLHVDVPQGMHWIEAAQEVQELGPHWGPAVWDAVTSAASPDVPLWDCVNHIPCDTGPSTHLVIIYITSVSCLYCLSKKESFHCLWSYTNFVT